MGKNSQKFESEVEIVSPRPKNENKIIAISFFVMEICQDYEILGDSIFSP